MRWSVALQSIAYPDAYTTPLDFDGCFIVSCDLTEEIYYGGQKDRVLCTFPPMAPNKSLPTRLQYETPINPVYIPISKGTFEIREIYISILYDCNMSPVDFLGGKVIVRLHFKPL